MYRLACLILLNSRSQWAVTYMSMALLEFNFNNFAFTCHLQGKYLKQPVLWHLEESVPKPQSIVCNTDNNFKITELRHFA